MRYAMLTLVKRPVPFSILVCGAGLLSCAAARAQEPVKVDFVLQIQPLLAARCYECHGPKKQESDYRLDHKQTALAGGAHGRPAIVPGKSGESPLFLYVSGANDDYKMPPEGQSLGKDELALLKRWIDEGAAWPESASVALAANRRDHWAFKAPVRPPLPAVRNGGWARRPLDAFILARLEKEGLVPSPEADRVTLLRRLSLDLIGLPPTPDEVEAFLADSSPTAYEEQVERLLKSPHYGERWGRHWLDAARYADSDGYEKDKSRQIWFYRDWVIGAFNRDLPYDRFLVEQLAGDLLPNATQDQIVATGFLRNSMLNEEGGVDPEQFRMDAMFDRLDAIGKSMLGLTIQCAQCHSHKFDPLTQEEYYKLFAFLNNDHEAQRVVYTAAEQMQIAELRRQMREIETALQHAAPDWREKLAEWEAAVAKDQPEWQVLELAHSGENAQRYTTFPDGSILAAGYAPTKFSAVFKATTEAAEIRSFRLELLTDPNLPAGGPGRSFQGTCALTEFKVEAADAQDPNRKKSVKFARASADYSNPERPLEANFDDKSKKERKTGPVAWAIDDNEDTAWGIDAGPGRRNQPRQAVFVAEENVAFPGGTVLTFHLVQKHGGWNSDDHMNNNLGRFRISLCAEEASADPLPKAVRESLAVPREKRTAGMNAALFASWRAAVPEWKEQNEQIEKLWERWPKGDTTLTLAARETPRATHLLTRGDFLKPAREVGAGVPAFLHPLADSSAPASRLTFANWVVDRRSPTTARVFVNRVWQAYFGTGLVATSEDFGLQSEKPSHGELLDWLAVEFMESGWSIKALHRQIVNSATYRQVSRTTPELAEKDPYNRLLARGARLRVEAEVVRDIALSSSGLLTKEVGGPAIFSPAPAFLFVPPTSYGPFTWTEAAGPERYRRAVYTFRRRSTPYPVLQNFDAPNGDFSCVRRTRSNTPLQALTTLNETVFMECAQALARRLLREAGKSDAERLTLGFRLCVARRPEPEELAELGKLLEKQRARLAAGELNAAEIAAGSKDAALEPPPGAAPADLAAYTIVARVLLNLDETITKE